MRKWITPTILIVCALLCFLMYFWRDLFYEDAGVVPEPVPCTITIDGVVISYVEDIASPTAPESGASLWWGSDSTTDGEFGYFIGHDYNAFGAVAELEEGDPVTVMDANGDSRTYYVFDSFDVPEGSYWDVFEDRVEGHGESIIMQTCIEGDYVRIVVAK